MLDRSKHRCADLGSCSECFVTSGGPLPQSTASVAIATVWDGGDSYECAIPLWCQSATAISKIIPNSELLMLTPKASAHCPHAVQMFPQTTNDAAQRYLSRYSRGGMTHGFSTANLLKFALFSLTRYELVLYADLDIDLAATMLTTETWRLHTASLLQTPALFVGLFDHASPVNGGLWLARPRCPLHRDAVRLLRHGSWSAHAGFDRIGSPHEIGANRTLMRPLLEKIASGSAASLFKVEGTLNYTQYFRWNRWDFVNGHLDQGMLWYLYAHAHASVHAHAHAHGHAHARGHAHAPHAHTHKHKHTSATCTRARMRHMAGTSISCATRSARGRTTWVLLGVGGTWTISGGGRSPGLAPPAAPPADSGHGCGTTRRQAAWMRQHAPGMNAGG
jgi:hypothetical protein